MWYCRRKHRRIWTRRLKKLARRSEKLASRCGKRVWTRQLVSHRINGSQTSIRVFLSNEDQPAFRCEFIRELGDKLLLVKGPDGAEYTVHKCYAGKNPACTVSFDGIYHPACDRAMKSIRNHPGTSWPDASTEVLDLRKDYPSQLIEEVKGS